jgi:hypothetical protein
VELCPERQDEIITRYLRDQVGVDPQSLRPVLRLTALGIVNLAWRNTCVEGWHVEGRLSNGDMLRVNSHMSWRLDQLLWRWRGEMGWPRATRFGRWTKSASTIYGRWAVAYISGSPILVGVCPSAAWCVTSPGMTWRNSRKTRMRH